MTRFNLILGVWKFRNKNIQNPIKITYCSTNQTYCNNKP